MTATAPATPKNDMLQLVPPPHDARDTSNVITAIAFAADVHPHLQSLYQWACRLTHDTDAAYDLVQDTTVRVWETETGRPVATFEGHTGGIWDVALSGDGRLAASVSDDQTVRLWDTASGQLLTTLTGHTNAVWGVALTADGRAVASASFDGTVRL